MFLPRWDFEYGSAFIHLSVVFYFWILCIGLHALLHICTCQKQLFIRHLFVACKKREKQLRLAVCIFFRSNSMSSTRQWLPCLDTPDQLCFWRIEATIRRSMQFICSGEKIVWCFFCKIWNSLLLLAANHIVLKLFSKLDT